MEEFLNIWIRVIVEVRVERKDVINYLELEVVWGSRKFMDKRYSVLNN